MGACLADLGRFQAVPPGFVPMQDKYYLVGIAQLPNGASLERTDAVVRQMSRIGLDEPGWRASWPSRACR